MKLEVTSVDTSTGYVFKLTGLPHGDMPEGYTYAVSEDRVADYQNPKYFNGDMQVMGADQIGDGGKIFNDQVGRVLPSTGGSGTDVLRLMGLILIALAIGGLALKRKKEWH